MLFYKGLSDITDDIIGTLKILYSFDEDFNYNTVDQKSSYLKIYEAFPRDTKSYPCIIFRNATMTPKIWGIGEEIREYSRVAGSESTEHGGSLEFSITLE